MFNRPFPLYPCYHNDCHIQQEDRTSHGTIHNLATCRVGRELQAQTAINNAENDEDAAVPDMRVAEVRPFADFLVLSVMQKAEERLEQEEADNDSAEGSMGCVKELKGMMRQRDSWYGIQGVERKVKYHRF